MAYRLLQMPFGDQIKQLAKKKALYRDNEIRIGANGCHFVLNNRDDYPPVITLTFKSKTDGEKVKTQVRLHILFYYLETGLVPDREIRETKLEMSHICSKSACVNVQHLSVEPHQINCDRRTCVSLHSQDCHVKCRGHGTYRECIFSPPQVSSSQVKHKKSEK